MAELTLRDAISLGLREAMDNDPRVIIMGEDVGAYNGAYVVTKGFLEEYGESRIIDTPISEAGFVGAGIGAAMAGLKPVVEIMTINFSLMASDQIINNAAKIHYMSGGQYSAPIIIRTVTGGGAGLAATHSQSFEGFYATIPGLKVLTPAFPDDALGLLRTAFKDNNPILYCEHALLYNVRGEIPDDSSFEVPFGKAKTRRNGSDITLVGYGRSVHTALLAAEKLQERNVDAEVIDLRTLRPLDIQTVVESTQKTHRCVVIEETWATGGFGSYVAYEIQKNAFDDLDGPVLHIGGLDVPAPYARNLEIMTIPNEQWILDAVEKEFGL